jgi:CHAT domain-containing protein
LEAIRASEPTGLVSALLSAGAATVIAAQWPIADISAMLLMTRFYQRLGQQAPPADLLAALDAAARDVRELTVPDLIDYGFQSAARLIDLGGSPGEADQVAGQCLRYALTAIGDGATANVVAALLADGQADGERDGRLAALSALRPAAGSGAATHPFTHAEHWGAFKVVGRTTEDGFGA